LHSPVKTLEILHHTDIVARHAAFVWRDSDNNLDLPGLRPGGPGRVVDGSRETAPSDWILAVFWKRFWRCDIPLEPAVASWRGTEHLS
jgi:hypothetical protein